MEAGIKWEGRPTPEERKRASELLRDLEVYFSDEWTDFFAIGSGWRQGIGLYLAVEVLPSRINDCEAFIAARYPSPPIPIVVREDSRPYLETQVLTIDPPPCWRRYLCPCL